MDLDGGPTSLEISGCHITVTAVVPGTGQDHHPASVGGTKPGRRHGDGEPGPIHGLIHVTGVGLIDPSVLLGGEDRLHRGRGYFSFRAD
jgi:hypothetical protein